MAKVTESQPVSRGSVQEFYDRLAPDYDAMTGFDERFVREQPLFRTLLEQHRIATAIDAGSGSGFHSLLLARLGIAVTAVDTSTGMLDRLRQHAARMGLPVQAIRSSFEELPSLHLVPVDAVFCLGNTLVHLLTDDALRLVLHIFCSQLRQGGTLVLQMLNYDRILHDRPRVLGVRKAGKTTFVRFYDYEGDLLRFNILALRDGPDGITHSLESISHRPILRDTLTPALGIAGLRAIDCYGGIDMEKFNPLTSKDLVIVARKP